MSYAVFTMVGPGVAEAGRLRTLLASLFRHEPATPLLVVVDDSGGDARLDGGGNVRSAFEQLAPANCECVRLVNPNGQDRDRLAPNTLIALRYLTARPEIGFAVKLDTDALVIAPFARRIGDSFETHPDVGQIGRAETRCDGTPAPNGFYTPLVRRLSKFVQVRRSPRWGVAHSFTGDAARFRRLLAAARANGLCGGRHCQGGAYAISHGALDRLAEKRLLVGDWMTRVCGHEDLLVSTLVAAAGMKVVSLAGAGEPFGVEHIGLPFAPAELVARGYALIHSIKNDARFAEADIVRFFEDRDAAKTNDVI